MRELLFKRYDPSAQQDRQEFYELCLQRTSDPSRSHSVRQTHYVSDGGRVSPTDHIIDLFKTAQEAADRYTLRRQTLVEIGFNESNIGPIM